MKAKTRKRKGKPARRRARGLRGGAAVAGFAKDSPLAITRAAAELAGRQVLEAGLRQCARGKHVYPDPTAGYGKCSRCGRSISRRYRSDGKGGYKLNAGKIH